MRTIDGYQNNVDLRRNLVGCQTNEVKEINQNLGERKGTKFKGINWKKTTYQENIPSSAKAHRDFEQVKSLTNV